MQNNAIILYYEVTYILSAKADTALFYLVSGRVDLEKRAQPGVSSQRHSVGHGVYALYFFL